MSLDIISLIDIMSSNGMDDKLILHDEALSKMIAIPAPIRVDTLKRIVEIALGPQGSVVPIPHCDDHMVDRHFDMGDVVHILETGDYWKRNPEWRADHQNWLYFVVGEDLDGNRLMVVFTVEEADSKIRIISGERFYRGERV